MFTLKPYGTKVFNVGLIMFVIVGGQLLIVNHVFS